MEPLRCTLCKQIFTTLPDGATRVGQRKGAFQMYLFPDGTAHNLGAASLGFQKGVKHAPRVKEKK
jgi:hypothetical protein